MNDRLVKIKSVTLISGLTAGTILDSSFDAVDLRDVPCLGFGVITFWEETRRIKLINRNTKGPKSFMVLLN